MTATEITKSNENLGCGKESVSATIDVWGACREEIFTRFSELQRGLLHQNLAPG